MKHLSKWFIATLAGVALFSSSCVDQVKFGDSFLGLSGLPRSWGSGNARYNLRKSYVRSCFPVEYL